MYTYIYLKKEYIYIPIWIQSTFLGRIPVPALSDVASLVTNTFLRVTHGKHSATGTRSWQYWQYVGHNVSDFQYIYWPQSVRNVNIFHRHSALWNSLLNQQRFGLITHWFQQFVLFLAVWNWHVRNLPPPDTLQPPLYQLLLPGHVTLLHDRGSSPPLVIPPSLRNMVRAYKEQKELGETKEGKT